MTAPRKSKSADQLTSEIYGADSVAELVRSQVAPFDAFSPVYAAQIIDGADDGTDIAAMVEAWRREDAQRVGPGGRPARVQLRSMLILWLMHAIAHKPLTVMQFATTVSMGLSPAQLKTIGLTEDGADTNSWYQSIKTAKDALQRLVDPYAYPRYRREDPARPAVKDRINRHRILTAEKRQDLKTYWDDNAELNEMRQERLDDLMFEINANVIRSAADLLKNFTGDIALDATYTKAHGRHSAKDLRHDARSVLIEAGLWMREGSHGVKDSAAKTGTPTKFKFGFETDIVTMTLGPTDDAPELILGMNLHRPGSVRHVARTLFPRIERLGLPKGTISVDRLYNDGLRTKDFHLPLLQYGYEFAFDYKDDQVGAKANFHRDGVSYLLVDGTWYLASMPEELVKATEHARLPVDKPEHIDTKTLALRIAARQPYQLTRFGRRQADGYQRYLLPDPDNYLPAFDYDTGELLAKPKNKTVTIPGSIGLKWQQKHPYLSPEWKAAYNLRSAVERKNSQLKRGTTTDLDNADKRPQRSFVAHSLSVAILVAAHNHAQIRDYILKQSGEDHSKGPLKRASRRDEKLQLPAIQKQKDGRSRSKAA